MQHDVVAIVFTSEHVCINGNVINTQLPRYSPKTHHLGSAGIDQFDYRSSVV